MNKKDIFIGEAPLSGLPKQRFRYRIKDGAISTDKIKDKAITNSKIADEAITNDKLAPEAITQDKLDKELLAIFKAAANLPEDLIQTIQDVDVTLKDHQQQITSNNEDISDLQTKVKQNKDTIDGIAVSGGASVASAVTYDNTTSGLESENVQNAIDKLPKNKNVLTPIFSSFVKNDNNLIFYNCLFVDTFKAIGVGKATQLSIDINDELCMYWLSSTEDIYTPFYENVTYSNGNSIAYHVIKDDVFIWENIRKRDYRDLLYAYSKTSNIIFGIMADAVKESKASLVSENVQNAIDKLSASIISAEYSRNVINKKDSFVLADCTFVDINKGIGLGKAMELTIDKGGINKMYWLSSSKDTYTPFYSNHIGLAEKQQYYVIKDETFQWENIRKRDYRDLLLCVGNEKNSVFGILADEYILYMNTPSSISDNYLFNDYFKELYICNEKLDSFADNPVEINVYKGLKLNNIYITGFNIMKNIEAYKIFNISDYKSEEDCKNAAENYNPLVLSMNGISAVLDWDEIPSGMVSFKNITLFKDRVSSLIQNQRCAIEQGFYGLSNYQYKKEEIGALYNTDGVTLHTEHNLFYTTDYIKVDKPTLFYGNFYRGGSTLVDSVYIYNSDKTFKRSFKTSKADDYVMVYPNTYVRFTYEHSGNERITGYNRLFYAKDIRTCVQNIYESRWKGKTVYWFGDSLIHNGMITSTFEKLTECVTKNFAYGAHAMADISGDRLDVLPRIEDNLGNDADLIIISSGVNDHRSGVPLGKFEYATKEAYIKNVQGGTEAAYRMTFYGALHTICKYLIAKYNQKIPIVFLTPMHNAYPITDGSDSWEIDKSKWENEGIIDYRKANPLFGESGILPDYVEAIKKVAEFYGMQVVDTHAISSLQPSVISVAKEYFLAKEDSIDGIHPNYMGSERICKMILPFLEQLDYSVVDTNRKFYN